jgi:hypothetical protein
LTHRGSALASLSTATIRTVAQGVLRVALIQGILVDAKRLPPSVMKAMYHGKQAQLRHSHQSVPG